MIKQKFVMAVAFSALSCALAAPASASAVLPGTVAISGLFNTGVDANGDALVGGDGTLDSHYTVFASTIGGVTTGVNAVTYKHPSYAADTTGSRWISHSGNGSPGNGKTTFRLTFDLTGLDASTAAITGFNAVDNAGRILLNGVDTGIAMNGAFGVLLEFNISSGFVAGLNTLDFVVEDFGPPMALRIDALHGTAQLAAVPLPGSIVMLAPALLGLGALRRKRAA